MERAEKYYLDNPELKEERAMLIGLNWNAIRNPGEHHFF